MPLETGKSKAAFSHNVETEVAAGKPQKQAVAIAYAKARGDDAGSVPSSGSPTPRDSGQTVKASGVMLVSKADRVLLMRRTDGRGWAFPGGGIEEEENAEQAARRELTEETGQEHDGPMRLWTRRVADGVDFSTHIAKADKEFEPTLNDEHDAWAWVPRDLALSSSALHPGVSIALRRFDMDELGIAKAIRDGELASPQRYGNMLLIAIRITGTGLAYRHKCDEFVWRDPSIYMTEEFLERCAGLSVVAEHPEGNMLDTTEYRDRIVGSAFLPYLKPEAQEVWSIAKIMDMRAAYLLETEPMTTSPAIVFMGIETGTEFELENGKMLLIEGKPSLLDHIALLLGDRAELDDPVHEGFYTGAGVWDRGKPISGVASVDVDVSPKIDEALDIIQNSKIDAVLRTIN